MHSRRPFNGILLRKPIAFALVGALGYLMLASGTIALTSDGRDHATVWPADAIILALLLNSGRRHWPLLLTAGWLGNLAANGLTREWTIGIILYGAINMGQVLLAAWSLRRSGDTRNLLSDVRAVGRFVIWAGLFAPLMGAAVGSLVASVNYNVPIGPSFIRWFASNSLGLLVCTPFLNAVFDGSYRRCFAAKSLWERGETLALMAIHAAVTIFVFGQNHLPILFLSFTSLLLLSFRIGRLGTYAGVMLVAIIGAVSALQHFGPMALINEGAAFQAIFFQAYLATLLVTTLPVAAIVASRAEALGNLAAREETLRLIMAHSPDVILSFDNDGVCRWADGPVREYLGLGPEELFGNPAAAIALRTGEELLVASGRPTDERRTEKAIEFSPILQPALTLEASFRDLTRDGMIVGRVVTLRDATARKAREQAITIQVETDDLTGVKNRAGFRRHVRAALADTSRPCSVAIVDVDHFKVINDRYGHQVGDAVLMEIAQRLTAGIRQSDIVGRIGGDEFAILFQCDLETAKLACERIAYSISQRPIFSDDTLLVLTSISCGVAGYMPGMSRDQLFEAADTALYQVKRDGRNGVRAAG